MCTSEVSEFNYTQMSIFMKMEMYTDVIQEIFSSV